MGKSLESLQLESLKKVHIIGVCGTLMGAFAAFLQRRGVRVTGSDQNVYPPMSDVLKTAGVELISGYRAENIQKNNPPDLIVIGNVIGANNPEAREAIDKGYVYSSLPEAMERLLLQKTRNLVVAGTHGKTTTSSLLAHVLVHSQLQPNYFIGGVSHDLPFSFHLEGIQSGKPFVLEGDEYDTAFWDKVPKFNHYLPDDVILTSIEYDHADIYPDMAAVLKAFDGLRTRIRSGGNLIACFDYPHVRDFASRCQHPVYSYGISLESQARFTPGNIRTHEGLTSFEVLDQKKKVDEITIQLSGAYNVLNALAVWIECQRLGIDRKLFLPAFRSFRGVKRRQEERGEVNGILVIDDFAHHPTAVRETLRGLRLKYPNRRIVSVFEPRSATSRRKVFQNEYAEAFQEADLIFISSPFDQTRISADNQFSSETLIEDLKKRKKEAYLMETVDQGVIDVSHQAKSGDLIAVLSNGGFDGFIQKLLLKLANS